MSKIFQKLSGKFSQHDDEHSDRQSEIHREAPIVKEKVHDHIEHRQNVTVDEIHDQTEIRHVIQPITQSKTEAVDVKHVKKETKTVVHGEELVDDDGLDEEAKALLRGRREKMETASVHSPDEIHTTVDVAPVVNVSERHRVIEVVQPVIEVDIHRPHVIEEHRHVVEVHKEKTKSGPTTVAPPMTIEEWEETHN